MTLGSTAVLMLSAATLADIINGVGGTSSTCALLGVGCTTVSSETINATDANTTNTADLTVIGRGWTPKYYENNTILPLMNHTGTISSSATKVDTIFDYTIVSNSTNSTTTEIEEVGSPREFYLDSNKCPVSRLNITQHNPMTRADHQNPLRAIVHYYFFDFFHLYPVTVQSDIYYEADHFTGLIHGRKLNFTKEDYPYSSDRFVNHDPVQNQKTTNFGRIGTSNSQDRLFYKRAISCALLDNVRYEEHGTRTWYIDPEMMDHALRFNHFMDAGLLDRMIFFAQDFRYFRIPECWDLSITTCSYLRLLNMYNYFTLARRANDLREYKNPPMTSSVRERPDALCDEREGNLIETVSTSATQFLLRTVSSDIRKVFFQKKIQALGYNYQGSNNRLSDFVTLDNTSNLWGINENPNAEGWLGPSLNGRNDNSEAHSKELISNWYDIFSDYGLRSMSSVITPLTHTFMEDDNRVTKIENGSLPIELTITTDPYSDEYDSSSNLDVTHNEFKDAADMYGNPRKLSEIPNNLSNDLLFALAMSEGYDMVIAFDQIRNDGGGINIIDLYSNGEFFNRGRDGNGITIDVSRMHGFMYRGLYHVMQGNDKHAVFRNDITGDKLIYGSVNTLENQCYRCSPLQHSQFISRAAELSPEMLEEDHICFVSKDDSDEMPYTFRCLTYEMQMYGVKTRDFFAEGEYTCEDFNNLVNNQTRWWGNNLDDRTAEVIDPTTAPTASTSVITSIITDILVTDAPETSSKSSTLARAVIIAISAAVIFVCVIGIAVVSALLLCKRRVTFKSKNIINLQTSVYGL